jgi:hypothetical protein
MSNDYNSTLNQNNIDLQRILNTINTLPEAGGSIELPTLTNEGTASDMLSEKQLIDSEGKVVTGNIPTKTASDITVSGAIVTVPIGYYAEEAEKLVTTATRAETTISVSADDTNDKLTITASNNQGTGYVTGANKTASKTITLTANGGTVTASDGSTSINKSVSTATQATPSISINSSTGLITATATQTAGYVAAGTKSSTYQMAFQPAQTITPGTTDKTIAENTYLGGVQTIKGDANLVASNIVSGKSIFGVVGTATTGGGGDSSDVTAETNAYTEKLATLETAITALENELQGKATGGGSIEAWTGNITSPHLGTEYAIHYTDASLTHCTATVFGGWGDTTTTITIAAGTLIYVVDGYGAVGDGFVLPIEDDYRLLLPTSNNFEIGIH